MMRPCEQHKRSASRSRERPRARWISTRFFRVEEYKVLDIKKLRTRRSGRLGLCARPVWERGRGAQRVGPVVMRPLPVANFCISFIRENAIFLVYKEYYTKNIFI